MKIEGEKATRRTAAILGALMLSLAGPSWAGGFKGLARELGGAGRRAGMQRVAVVALAPADGSRQADGWGIAEKLTTYIVRSGKVQAVERSLLQHIMEEHRLGRTGAVDPASLRRLGKLAAVDGVVTGSFVMMGRRAVVNARLVDVETGVIVAAAEAEVEREWFDMPGMGASSIFVRAPVLDVPVPVIVPVGEEEPFPGLVDARDAVAEPCLDAAARVDALEAEVLDLKARYWAAKLKSGVEPGSLKANPGSTITDPGLKRRFYAEMRRWYAQDAVPELTPEEVRKFVSTDQKAYTLYSECGL